MPPLENGYDRPGLAEALATQWKGKGSAAAFPRRASAPTKPSDAPPSNVPMLGVVLATPCQRHGAGPGEACWPLESEQGPPLRTACGARR